MPEEWARKNMGGIVGVRLIRELNGFPCLELQDPLDHKKMIACTRMFGNPVYQLSELTEAIATYTSRVAEKLRRQWCNATFMDVFVVSNDHPENHYQYNPETIHAYCTLPVATSDTQELIRHAVPLIRQLYRPGSRYLKAGIVVSGLVPDNVVQSNLFLRPEKVKSKKLMEAVDNINASISQDSVKYAVTGLDRKWKMRQDMKSPRYTSQWDELKSVK
jgi:DNA polymerase V